MNAMESYYYSSHFLEHNASHSLSENHEGWSENSSSNCKPFFANGVLA